MTTTASTRKDFGVNTQASSPDPLEQALEGLEEVTRVTDEAIDNIARSLDLLTKLNEQWLKLYGEKE